MPGSGKLRGGAGGAGQAALSRSLQGQPEMALEQTTGKDWYQILGAQPSDSPAELKRKYQRLALLYHPDKQKADVPAGEVEERVQRFIEIDQAWKILGNEETKKEYDLQQRGISFGRNHSILLTILFVLTIYWDVFLWLHLSKGEQVMQRNSENLTSCGPGVTYCSRPSLCKGIKMGPFQSQPCCDSVDSTEDNLTKEWPLHAQIYLEDMSWNEDEQCYTLSCRCGGSYAVSESESKDVSLVCCDTCSLVIEILR